MNAYDPARLEIHIYARGPNRWEWIVAEKGKAAIVSGETTGARRKAEAAAYLALIRLKER